MKIFLLLVISFITLNGSVIVYKANKTINFKQTITPSLVKQYRVNNIQSSCIPITLKDFKAHQYKAKMILKKGRIVCLKDLYIPTKNKIIFNFGNIQFEREGKVIKETDNYIRFRDTNGKIQKIYKDGRD